MLALTKSGPPSSRARRSWLKRHKGVRPTDGVHATPPRRCLASLTPSVPGVEVHVTPVGPRRPCKGRRSPRLSTASGHAESGTPERAGPPTNVGLKVLPAVRVPVELWFRRASDLVELVGCPVGPQVFLSIAWLPTTLAVLVVSVCGLRAATKVNKVATMTSPP